MSDNHAAVHDSLRKQLAAANCIAPTRSKKPDGCCQFAADEMPDRGKAALFPKIPQAPRMQKSYCKSFAVARSAKSRTLM